MGSKNPTHFADKLDASPVYSAPAATAIEPSSERPLFSAGRLAAAADRQQLLKQALPLFESKLNQAEVAPLLGISPASLSRLLNLCPVKGDFARKALAKCRRLVKLPLARLAPKVASDGRQSDFAALIKVKAIVRHLEQRYACHCAAGQSQAACIRAAIQDLGYCKLVPPLAARRLRMGAQPKPFSVFLKRAFNPKTKSSRRTSDYSKN